MQPPAPPTVVYEPLEPNDPRSVGGYQILARLGAGGMGRVYLATTQSGRKLAMKVVRAEFTDDPEFRRRFQQEIAAAQRVQSLYTAPVIDANPEGPQMWLATAYIPGPSLAQAIMDQGPLPPQTVRILAAGVAEALQAIHRAGVIHRDLKPSNVLLASDGPRVIDFGIARAADATPLTRTGVRIGSPQFMAPEQALGRPSSPAIDIFALGALTFFAATGRSPFGEGPDAAVLFRIAHQEPDLARCPDELRPFIARCLAKEPEQRPGLRELIDELQPESFAPTQTWLPPDVTRRLSDYTAAPPPPAGQPSMGPPTLPAHAASPAPSAAPARPTGPTVNRNLLIALGTGGGALLLALVIASALIGGGNGSPDSPAGTTNDTVAQAGPTGGQAADASGDTTTVPAGKPPGTLLGTYQDINLTDGNVLSFTDDPKHPKDSGSGDFYYTGGFFNADRMAVLEPGQPGSYENCKDNTRYFSQVSDGDIPAGRLLCITTRSGLIGLIKVNGYEDSPSRYVSLDLTVWQGTPPSVSGN